MTTKMAYDVWVEEEHRRDVEAALRVILRLGRRRCGNLDAVAEAKLLAIDDLDRLDKILRAILSPSSWSELLSMR